MPNGVPAVALSGVTPRGVWTLGTVALYRPRKGLEVLLDALALLTAGLPVRLRAVGPFETPMTKPDQGPRRATGLAT